MSHAFYILRKPESHRPYGRAEWADEVDMIQIKCPKDPGHQRGGDRIGNLVIHLPKTKIGDFTWTWYSEPIITRRVYELFKEAGLTGFGVAPVTVKSVKGAPPGFEPPELLELLVVGNGGYADPRCGIAVKYRCEACGLIKYSPWVDGILVDESKWDGSDFFTVMGFPAIVLVTERVKEFILAERLTNCILIPAHQYRNPLHRRREE